MARTSPKQQRKRKRSKFSEGETTESDPRRRKIKKQLQDYIGKRRIAPRKKRKF
jgi:hypothetical protein